MSRKLILFFSILIFSFSIFSQTEKTFAPQLKKLREMTFLGDSVRLFRLGDSINSMVSEKYKSEVELYYGNFFFYNGNVNRAIYFFQKSSKDASKNRNTHIYILAKAREEYIKPDNYHVIEKLNTLYRDAESHKDYENMAEILNFISILKKENNDLQGDAKLAYEGLKLAEKHGLIYYQGVFKSNLGLINYNIGKYDEAVQDFISALSLAKQQDNKNLIDNARNNLAITYLQLGKIDEAFTLIHEVLADSKKHNHLRKIATSYINIGSLYVNVSDYDKGVKYLDSAISISAQKKFIPELIKAMLGKSDIYIYKKEPEKALSELNKIKPYLDSNRLLEDEKQYWGNLNRIYEQLHQPQNAYFSLKKYNALKDSIKQMAGAKVIEKIKFQFDIEEKEADLEKEKIKKQVLINNIQKEKYQKFIIIGVLIGVLVFGFGFFLVFYQYKSRIRKEKYNNQLIEYIEAERSRISKDLHDDIGHSLSIIKARIVRNKIDSNDGEESLKDYLSDVIGQVRHVSHHLYPSFLEKIGLTQSVSALLINAQKATGIECNYDICSEAESLSSNIQLHLYRIVQECLNNTIKHAQATGIRVLIEKKENKFHFIYEDNGIGLKSDDLKGIGLISVKERASEFKAKIKIKEKGKGFKLSLIFQ